MTAGRGHDSGRVELNFRPENIVGMARLITVGIAILSWFTTSARAGGTSACRRSRTAVAAATHPRIAWSGPVIDAMAMAETLAAAKRRSGRGRPKSSAGELLASLSAQVDRGRLYFANVTAAELGVPKGKETIGADREGAFQGDRRAIARLHRSGAQPSCQAAAGARRHADWRCRHDAALPAPVRLELQELIGRERLAIDENELTAQDLGDGIPSWNNVAGLVAELEAIHGPQSFWRDRPPVQGEQHPFNTYIAAPHDRRLGQESIAARLKKRSLIDARTPSDD